MRQILIALLAALSMAACSKNDSSNGSGSAAQDRSFNYTDSTPITLKRVAGYYSEVDDLAVSGRYGYILNTLTKSSTLTYLESWIIKIDLATGQEVSRARTTNCLSGRLGFVKDHLMQRGNNSLCGYNAGSLQQDFYSSYDGYGNLNEFMSSGSTLFIPYRSEPAQNFRTPDCYSLQSKLTAYDSSIHLKCVDTGSVSGNAFALNSRGNLLIVSSDSDTDGLKNDFRNSYYEISPDGGQRTIDFKGLEGRYVGDLAADVPHKRIYAMTRFGTTRELQVLDEDLNLLSSSKYPYYDDVKFTISGNIGFTCSSGVEVSI